MSQTDELLKNNEAYASNFDKAELPLPPAKKVAVLACMDARLNPYGALNMEGESGQVRLIGHSGMRLFGTCSPTLSQIAHRGVRVPATGIQR